MPPPLPPQRAAVQKQPSVWNKNIGLGGCLMVLICIGVIGFAIMQMTTSPPEPSSTNSSRSSEPSSATSSPKVAATARVSLSYDTIHVSNLDTFDWPRTSIYIDGLFSGYIYRVASIRSGETVTIPLREFTTRGGERFDPDRRKPKEVIVHPDGYDGRQFRY